MTHATANAIDTHEDTHSDDEWSQPSPEERDEFRIPVERYDYLCKRIEKLCRRRHKLLKSGPLADAAPISVTVLRTESLVPCFDCKRTEDKHRDTDNCDGFVPGTPRYFHICNVTGPAVRLEGYEFLATLQHETAGTILRTVPGATIADGELDRFRTVKPHCEHCKVRRYRKDSFVVRHIESGETIQLGRNCVGKYIGGGASPKAIAALAELMIELRDVGDEESEWVGGSSERYAWLPLFLTFVATSVRLNGWTSRSVAREDDRRIATADHVWWMMFPGSDHKSKEEARAFRQQVSAADRQVAINAMLLAGKKLVNAGRLNDYEHNLRISLASQFVTGRKAGIVASLIGWYERAVGIEAKKRAEREARKAARLASKHLGTVGERQEFGTVTLTRVVDSESEQWGVSHGHFFTDVEGNILVWWTSSKRLDVGTTYTLRGTVKKHDDYKGTKQTVLSRCAVKEAG
jgi:hypothetical protein